jgi:hypothetical protein
MKSMENWGSGTEKGKNVAYFIDMMKRRRVGADPGLAQTTD